MDVLYTALLSLILLLSACAGSLGQRRLSERHASRDTVESVRLLMGMLLTFSALVLGLLTSAAKEHHDGYNNQFAVYSADLIELDHRLRNYGRDADGIRAMLRSYIAAAIADTWPDEPPPSGTFPRFNEATPADSIEGTSLGAMVANIDLQIESLAPPDAFHQRIAARLRDRSGFVVQQRWQLILSSHPTISWPFLIVLTSWLAIVFLIFGLTAPRNALVYTVVTLAALSIASPLYLIISYSDAAGGRLQLSSASMRVALAHMDQPE